MSKFNGDLGCKPSTEARRFVYKVLADSLAGDPDCERFDGMGLDEFDKRRVRGAVKKVIVELKRKARGGR